jgi:hypothetical protein
VERVDGRDPIYGWVAGCTGADGAGCAGTSCVGAAGDGVVTGGTRVVSIGAGCTGTISAGGMGAGAAGSTKLSDGRTARACATTCVRAALTGGAATACGVISAGAFSTGGSCGTTVCPVGATLGGKLVDGGTRDAKTCLGGEFHIPVAMV